ncbi:MAG: hypothetical protein ACRCWY_05470 [Cellulosilyticaceae bacterium]
MSNKIHTHTKRKLHLGRLTMCVSILVIFCAVTLYGIHTYTNPSIYGKWCSLETNKTIEFKKDGKVILEDSSQKPTFKLLEPHQMSYSVEQKVFDMYYALEGRELKWGMDETNVESFKRK